MPKVRATDLSLCETLNAVPARIQLHLEILAPCSLLWVCAVEEAVHAKRLAKLDVSLRLVRLLSLAVKLYTLRTQISTIMRGILEDS